MKALKIAFIFSIGVLLIIAIWASRTSERVVIQEPPKKQFSYSLDTAEFQSFSNDSTKRREIILWKNEKSALVASTWGKNLEKSQIFRHSVDNASAPPSFGEASDADEWVVKYHLLDYYDQAMRDYGREIKAAADETGVAPILIASTIARESRCDPKAIGRDGELSLTQVMPTTGEGVGIPRDKLMDPKWNILAGARYYAWLYKHFKGNSTEAIVAYAWGNGRVEEARACCGGDLTKEANYQKVMAIMRAVKNR